MIVLDRTRELVCVCYVLDKIQIIIINIIPSNFCILGQVTIGNSATGPGTIYFRNSIIYSLSSLIDLIVSTGQANYMRLGKWQSDLKYSLWQKTHGRKPENFYFLF